MFNFIKKKPPILTLRLVALERADEDCIDRPALLEAITKTWRSTVGNAPLSYDIYGPYGIAKGRTVGLQAFENKLQRKGHEAYSGYSANDGQRAGFHVNFFGSPPYGVRFLEIVFWFASSELQIDPSKIVQGISEVARIDYGYVSELPGNYDVFAEAPIKRGIFGISVDVGNNPLSQWYKSVHLITEGQVRDIYSINFLNQKQVDALRHHCDVQVSAIAQELYSLRIDSVTERTRIRNCLREKNNVSP